jgi:hypothetical protein
MANNKDYVPTKEKDFYTWVKNLVAKATGYKSGWDLPPSEAAAWTLIIDPATGYLVIFTKAYDKVATGEFEHKDKVRKDDALKVLKSAVRKYYMKYIRNNDSIPNDERADMGLPVFDETKTPAPEGGEPNTKEDLIGGIKDNEHLKTVSSVLSPGSTSRAKGEGVFAMEVWFAYTAPDEKCPPIDQFKPGGEVSGGYCAISHTTDQVGKCCWMMARKVFKGKPKTYGHWSAPWNTIVC